MKFSSYKAFAILVIAVLVWVGGVVAFNIKADPYCLNCKSIAIDHGTLNPYYRVGQNLLSYPETQQIVLGSSRAAAMPWEWLEKHSKLKTLNLAAGGSDVIAKISFIRMAEAFTKVSSVIWITDYFEFLENMRNDKFLESKAIKQYVEKELPKPKLGPYIQRLGFEIDHNTFEASFSFLKARPQFLPSKGGPGMSQCRPQEREKMTTDLLMKIEGAKATYTNNIFRRPFSTQAWETFANEMKRLAKKHIHVLMLIAPYHPYFREDLKNNHPEIYAQHLRWIENLEKIQNKYFRVVNFFSGLPDDDPGPHHWTDGDHFKCFSAISMLELSGIKYP